MTVFKERPADLKPEYFFADEASQYLKTTKPKIAMYRKYGLLKYAKFGKNFVYKKSWLDDFAEEWSGYDLSNEAKIRLAINAKKWRSKYESR